MARSMSLVGGARINPQGEFEVTIGKGPNQSHMLDGPLKQYTKDHFNFLTSPDTSRQIGGSLVTKNLTRNGLPTVAFTFLQDFRVSLFLKQPGYAVFVQELPFTEGALDGEVDEGDYGPADEMDPEGSDY